MQCVKAKYSTQSELYPWICECPTCKTVWWYGGKENFKHTCKCGTEFLLIIDEDEIPPSFMELISNGSKM